MADKHTNRCLPRTPSGGRLQKKKRASVAEGVGNGDSWAPSVGMLDAAAAMKTGWQFFKKLKRESAIQPSNSTSESLPKRTESRVLKRYLYTHVHSSTIHNSNLQIYQ